MANNIGFANALNNQAVLKKADATLRANALDDLLKADLANPSAVRQSIIAHKDFWSLFPELKDLKFEDNDELLAADAKPEFQVLHQLTAQIRVALGVKTAADDVLVGILKNNPDEVRAYLASKPELGHLGQAHGWKKDEAVDPAQEPPAPLKNKSVHVLTNAAIKELQRQALMIYLRRYIDTKVSELSVLYTLEEASSADFKDFVENKLKLQQTASLSDTDIQELKALIPDRRRALLKAARSDFSDPNKFQDTLEKANGEVEQVIERYKAITKNSRKFEFINQIKAPFELYNPASTRLSQYQATKIKAGYKDIADECALVLKQIEQTQKVIKGLNSSLPKDGDLNVFADDEHKQEIQAFRSRLQEELDVVEQDLKFYQEIYYNLDGTVSADGTKNKDGILNAIGSIVNPKGTYIPIPENVKLTICDEDDISKGVAPTAIGSNHFASSNIPTGKIARFDVYKSKNKDLPVSFKDKDLLGSFTYTPSNASPGGMNTKESLYRNDSGGVYKVTSFPSGKAEIDQLDYAMTLVASLVNRLEEAPSKEKPLTLYGDDPAQLRLMWTALLLAGKYNSRFKFGEDEILLVPYKNKEANKDGSEFNPAGEKLLKPQLQVIAQLLGFSSNSFISKINFGFASESLFNRYTKDPYLSVVKRKMTVLNDQRSAAQDAGKVGEQAMINAEKIKAENQQIRKAEKEKNNEGPEQKSKSGPTN